MLMIVDPLCLFFAEVNYFPRRMPEQDIKQFRAKAAECLEQAKQARHQPDQEAWLKLAKDWIALAQNSNSDAVDSASD
jgi:hypothetical protein